MAGMLFLKLINNINSLWSSYNTRVAKRARGPKLYLSKLPVAWEMYFMCGRKENDGSKE